MPRKLLRAPKSSALARHHRTAFDLVALALVPFARLYLEAGLGALEFTTAVKLAFIRAAATASATGGKLNISAVSVSTGLTRKEVRALLDLGRKHSQLPSRDMARQRTTRVIQGWQSDPAFLDRAGSPAALRLRRGAGASFEALVRRYAGDVTPMSVLAELRRVGAVTLGKTGLLRLRKPDARAQSHKDETLALMAGRVRDLASTLLANAGGAGRPTFTGFRELKALPAEAAAVFNKTFTERSAQLLDAAEHWIALQPKRRRGVKPSAAPQHRVGIGVYLIDETGDAEQLPPRRAHRRRPKSLTPP